MVDHVWPYIHDIQPVRTGLRGGDREPARKTPSRVPFPRRRRCWSASPPVALGHWRCSGPRPLARGGFFVLCYVVFSVFFGMVRRWLYPDVRIRSSPPYPRSGVVSCIDGGRVESCVRPISWDPVGFRVRLCGFRSVFSDLRLSSLATRLLLWCAGPLEP
jgi:hypothetical protein